MRAIREAGLGEAEVEVLEATLEDVFLEVVRKASDPGLGRVEA